jgi:hypothetical protein
LSEERHAKEMMSQLGDDKIAVVAPLLLCCSA